MRRLLALLTAASFCFVGIQAMGGELPGKIVIKAAAKKQPAVPFSHARHATKLAPNCETCHHTQKGLTAKSTEKVAACTSCHLDPAKDVPGMREMSLTKNPFHIDCIKCHKAEKKGPVACTGCHVKA